MDNLQEDRGTLHERYPGMNEYTTDAMRTAAAPGTVEAELAVCGLGLSGEAGEVADHIKKILFHAHPLDGIATAKIADELGDVLWYVARCARAIGTSLDAVAAGNIDKLARRYPDGFDTERSRRHNEAADAVAVAIREQLAEVSNGFKPPRNAALEAIKDQPPLVRKRGLEGTWATFAPSTVVSPQDESVSDQRKRVLREAGISEEDIERELAAIKREIDAQHRRGTGPLGGASGSVADSRDPKNVSDVSADNNKHKFYTGEMLAELGQLPHTTSVQRPNDG